MKMSRIYHFCVTKDKRRQSAIQLKFFNRRNQRLASAALYSKESCEHQLEFLNSFSNQDQPEYFTISFLCLDFLFFFPMIDTIDCKN